MNSLISVVIPCYRMGRYVGAALDSVGGQTHPEWEVLVVDDAGPEDGTAAAVAEFAARQPGHRVEFLKHEKNGGVSAARNTAVKAARGGTVALLDPDDLWLPDHLTRHVAVRGAAPERMVSASPLGIFQDGTPDRIEGQWGYSPWEQEIFPLSLALRNAMNPSGVVVSKALLDEVGGFDETPELQHTEDWDLWIRLVDAGAAFRFLPEVTALYRKHAGAATADSPAMRRRLRAFAAKHGGALLPDLSMATFRLVQRVEALEARLNWLQSNPVIRGLSGLRRLFGKSRNGKS